MKGLDWNWNYHLAAIDKTPCSFSKSYLPNQNKVMYRMNAIFVMSTPFPYGQAFSSRARNLTKLLCACGYHVHIISPESVGEENSDELAGVDYSVTHINDPKTVLSLSGIGTAKPYMNAVNAYLTENKIDLIVSSSMIFVSGHLLKLAGKLQVPYIVEQCEWYDYSTFKYGKLNPYYREHIRMIEKKNRKVSGIIAISRLFEQHYSFQGVPAIRIPTILDVKNTGYRIERSNTASDGVYHIAFAGSLGKGKEKMEPVFKALVKINQTGRNIIFDIYGPSEKDLLINIDGDNNLWNQVQPYINVHGRILQTEVENAVRNADFTIFTRPIRRSSNAGFPTKFAESMAVGTPVITNDTGDISLYLRNGVNGFLIGNGTEGEILNAFETLISFNGEQYIGMRKNARNTAECNFSYSSYIEEMNSFLKTVQMNKR